LNWSSLMNTVVVTLVPIGLLIAIALIGLGANWLKAKAAEIKSTQLRNAVDTAISDIQNIAVQVVTAFEQTVVRPAKAAGTWSTTTATDTKNAAKTTITQTLSDATKALLPQITNDFESYLENLVQSVVFKLHQTYPAPVTPAPVSSKQKSASKTD